MLRRLKQLFSTAPRPIASFEDEILGALAWSDNKQGWVGICQAATVVIHDTTRPAPSPRLLQYARRMLGDASKLDRALADAKVYAQSRYDAVDFEEIENLRYTEISLFEHQGTLRIFASLEPSADQRIWRIEFEGDRCQGLGDDD
jgi:hypothetical protein